MHLGHGNASCPFTFGAVANSPDAAAEILHRSLWQFASRQPAGSARVLPTKLSCTDQEVDRPRPMDASESESRPQTAARSREQKSPGMQRRKALENSSNLGTTDTAGAANETVGILHATKYVARRALWSHAARRAKRNARCTASVVASVLPAARRGGAYRGGCEQSHGVPTAQQKS